jgi:formate dehydrogenase subunit gamma
MSKKIVVYSNIERFFHNHLLHFVFFLTISGLPILSHTFDFIAYGAGIPVAALTNNQDALSAGMSFMRFIHYTSAFILTLLSIPFLFLMLRKFAKLSMFPDTWGLKATIEGTGEMWKFYIKQEHAVFGKMNTGQKFFAQGIVIFMTIITISGYVIIFRDSFSVDLVAYARGAHAISFVFIGLLLMIHIYLATHPTNKNSYDAMFKTGEMDEEFIKDHHSIYYEQLKKQGKIK